MGQSQSSEEESQSNLYDKKSIEFEKNIVHRLYGDSIKVFKQKNNPMIKYALVQQSYNEENLVKKKIEEATEQKELDHDSIVKLVNANNYQKKELCSSFWQIQYFYEFIDHDLEKDIKQRIKYGNQYYQEDELFHIIASVVAAIAYLAEKNIPHGDICPQNILISFEGKIKLMPNKIIQTQNNLMCMMGIQSYNCYLSPIQLQSMKNGNKNPQHNVSKSDLYSLGIVIMEAALLKNMNDLFYINLNDINEYKKESYFQKIGEKYSKNLVEFIDALLTHEEAQRPSAAQFFSMIEMLYKKGLNISEKLYSMNEIMQEPIKLIQPLITSRQQNNSIKNITEIQPISHSPLNELKYFRPQGQEEGGSNEKLISPQHQNQQTGSPNQNQQTCNPNQNQQTQYSNNSFQQIPKLNENDFQAQEEKNQQIQPVQQQQQKPQYNINKLVNPNLPFSVVQYNSIPTQVVQGVQLQPFKTLVPAYQQPPQYFNRPYQNYQPQNQLMQPMKQNYTTGGIVQAHQIVQK